MKLDERMAWRKKRTDLLMKGGKDIGPWQNQKKKKKPIKKQKK